MALIPYTKLHATAAQRIAHLTAKGLIVANHAAAAHEIDLIGYERLRIYFLSRRQLTLPGRPFLPGITDQHILSIYACDRSVSQGRLTLERRMGAAPRARLYLRPKAPIEPPCRRLVA